MIIFVDSRMVAMHNGGTHKHRKTSKKHHKKKKHMTQTPTNGNSCFPFAINCRLSKTFFGVPRKCDQCHKIILLTAGYSCQFCRYRCHKKCRTSRPKLCSLSHLPAGDEELFHKVLRENEINSNDPASIFHSSWSSALTVSTESGYPKPSCSSSEFRDSVDSIETLTSAEPQSPAADGRGVGKSIPDDSEGSSKETVMDKFLRLLPWNRNSASLSVDRARSSRPSSLGLGRVPSAACSSGACPSSPVRTPVDEFNYSLLEGVFSRSLSTTSGVSTMGTMVCTGNTANLLSRRHNWVRQIAGERGAQSQDCVATDPTKLLLFSDPRLQVFPNENYGWLCSEEDEENFEHKERRSNTWPFFGMHMNHDDFCYDLEAADLSVGESVPLKGAGVGEESENSKVTKDERNSIAELSEWSILYEDLEFGDMVLKGWDIETYRGRWHGEVMIHKYKENMLNRFYQDVHNLTKIRHENVALFMGACTDPKQLAVVTSIRKVDSLFDAIHVRQRRLSHHSKVNIARQIAQGLGYLHAKKIILKCLNSKNIFLECKVKICMVDYSSGPVDTSDTSYGTQYGSAFCRGHLTYLSPELMNTLHIEPPSYSLDPELHTKQSDVYAFGTVLYEMYAGQYPLSELPAESIIWLIGNGQRQDVDHLSCHVAMKSLIEDCWSPDPSYRPSFAQILRELHQTAALHKKHSSSEPEKLHRTGLNRSPYHHLCPPRFGPVH